MDCDRIRDNDFVGHNKGLIPPLRIDYAPREALSFLFTTNQRTVVNLHSEPFALRIVNLDHSQPPGYTPGLVPRAPAFNENVFAITRRARMPPIEVTCAIDGFSPEETPIHWRLQCLHIPCRHSNIGDYTYVSACERLGAEWQGRASTRSFTLFGPRVYRQPVIYDHVPGETPLGGHALLTVAAKPPGARHMLQDYVHLRIVGTNPEPEDVMAYAQQALGDRHPNLARIIRAIFAHESDFRQFSRDQQTRRSFYIHKYQCRQLFDFPDDPPGYPNIAFDFGVGISQYTRVAGQHISAALVWDWRENIKEGINLLLTRKLTQTYQRGMTWAAWARAGWMAYNGTGARAAAYAQRLALSADGQAITDDHVNPDTVKALTAPLPAAPAMRPAPSWPPPSLSEG